MKRTIFIMSHYLFILNGNLIWKWLQSTLYWLNNSCKKYFSNLMTLSQMNLASLMITSKWQCTEIPEFVHFSKTLLGWWGVWKVARFQGFLAVQWLFDMKITLSVWHENSKNIKLYCWHLKKWSFWRWVWRGLWIWLYNQMLNAKSINF